MVCSYSKQIFIEIGNQLNGNSALGPYFDFIEDYLYLFSPIHPHNILSPVVFILFTHNSFTKICHFLYGLKTIIL